ncbi:hypothetical protein OQA87_21225 [Yersinia intermedia]|nr:hypothetical protein [Yersinia intermedia]MCW8114072.1 hypothetical protein [Yersinia intermedia]
MVTASYRTINDTRADLGIGIDRVAVQRQVTPLSHRHNIRF